MTRGILIGLSVTLCVAGADAPRRIVPLSPNVAEMLYGIGAFSQYGIGAFSQVVGVSDYSAYPPEARKLPSVGGWANPNLEKVAALRPDLVIVDDAQATLVGDNLNKLGLRVMTVKDHTIQESYGAMAALGQASGHEAAAAKLIAATREGLERVARQTAALAKPSVVLIVDRTPGTLRELYTATSGGYLAELVQIAGGRMAIAAVPGGYGKLSPEDLLAANPDWILDFIPANSGGAGGGPGGRLAGDPLQAWSGMPELKAVRNHQIRVVSEDYVVHSSQRMVETAQLFARLIHPGLK
ncbi:MAG TPA: helical backbone metal receptor [Bryobacteraceae bacterium]|nr:helical backbone metal receptor [Bryobacteraceae bacterium]